MDKITNKLVEAKIYNFKTWINTTDKKTIKSLDKILETVKYNVLNYVEYEFPNNAYTALWLLAESHLAVHSFVESNKTYIELSGCNEQMNILFEQIFKKEFQNLIVEN
jgi:S-adenosylmethionine decarboxylase